MFIRGLVLAIGLCGALGAAQFPAYSQQYMQRLGGAVDALAVVVANFDASAAAVGMNRSEALAQMTGTAFLDRRRADMQASIARYQTLQQDLAVLQDKGPFMRAYHVAHLTDRKIAAGALRAFEPALPMSMVAIMFAAFGFVTAAAATAFGVSLVRPRQRRVPEPA